MLEMKITIAAPDLAAAINSLAAALAAALANGNNTAPAEKATAPIASAPVAQPATPAAPVNPTPAPVAAPQQAPGAPLSATPVQTATPIAPTVPVATPVPAVTPVANVAPAVPTAAPTYTLEMIARAGTALVDAGKMDLLMGLLSKYNVEALTALNPAQYGIFATELRSLGAQI